VTKPNPQEFERFAKLLMQTAPKNYKPHFFRLEKNEKNPVLGLSWKSEKARLTVNESIKWLKQGGNIGIAGIKNDPLILIDGDSAEVAAQFKKTLTSTSRMRIAGHAFHFVKGKNRSAKINCPTEKGEIRSVGQYVVAPGSFVPTPDTEIYLKHWNREISHKQLCAVLDDPQRGFYTIKDELTPCPIVFDEIPSIFKERIAFIEKQKKKVRTIPKFEPKKASGNRSALFDLKISDLVSAKSCSERFPHPLHASDTGGNFCVSGGLGHCWRHLVSLNAIQFLTVKSGYMSCLEAGTSHANGGAGNSQVSGDDGCIFWAWWQAKKDGVIPENDPIPLNAIHYIARKHKVCDPKLIPKRSDYGKKMLPVTAYNKVIDIVERRY